MKTPRYAVQYRRKREGRTDYRKRTVLLLSGRPRVVIRRSIRKMIVQIVMPAANGDKVVAAADSGSLKKLGWKRGLNLSSAYMTGFLAGVRAKSRGVSEGIADIRRPSAGGRIYAALKGLVDSGFSVPHDESVFPADERVKGVHINKEVSAEMDALKQKIVRRG